MKVILHKLFPYAPYLNEYIGFEKEVGDSEEEGLEAIKNLRELAERSHRERYPEIYSESGLTAIPGHPMNVTQIDSRDEKIKAMFITISECRTVRNLEMFASEVQRLNEPSLFESYNNKKKELQ